MISNNAFVAELVRVPTNSYNALNSGDLQLRAMRIAGSPHGILTNSASCSFRGDRGVCDAHGKLAQPFRREQRDAQRRVFAGGAGQLLGQKLVDRPAVPEVGELVVRGLLFQGAAGIEQAFLQVDDAAAGTQSELELRLIDRFAEIVIGPRLQS